MGEQAANPLCLGGWEGLDFIIILFIICYCLLLCCVVVIIILFIICYCLLLCCCYYYFAYYLLLFIIVLLLLLFCLLFVIVYYCVVIIILFIICYCLLLCCCSHSDLQLFSRSDLFSELCFFFQSLGCFMVTIYFMITPINLYTGQFSFLLLTCARACVRARAHTKLILIING